MNKGIFPALDDFNSFVVGLLIKSGSDVEYLISYWNQLVSNLPFDEFVTINLYNQCYDDDILGRSIEAKGFTHNSRATDQSNMLETKCVSDNLRTLMTELINLPSVCNIKSPT